MKKILIIQQIGNPSLMSFFILLISSLIFLCLLSQSVPALENVFLNSNFEKRHVNVFLTEKQDRCVADSNFDSYNIYGEKVYEIWKNITLKNNGIGKATKIKLWVALIQSMYPYQQIIYRDITPSCFTIVTDEYKNEYTKGDIYKIQ